MGQRLVIQGAILGCILVSLLGYFITAGAALAVDEPVTFAEQQEEQTLATHQPDEAKPPEKISADQECKISARYPAKIQKWCQTITAYAEKHQLPPDLVAAVIWQESGGNPEAYSRSGAVGLMQVMPRDGLAASFQCVNGPCFANRPSIEQLKNPDFNVKYGTRMLASLVKRNGNYRDALKAYGPMDRGYSYADIVLKIYKQHKK